jgi:hypothetical protein
MHSQVLTPAYLSGRGARSIKVWHGRHVVKHAVRGWLHAFISVSVIANRRFVSSKPRCVRGWHLSSQQFWLVQRERHVPLHFIPRHLKTLLCTCKKYGTSTFLLANLQAKS